eukprot:226572-Prymnesium_polylepis.1
MRTALITRSNGRLLTSLQRTMRQALAWGALRAALGFIRKEARTVATHCCCASVMVAEPSRQALMRLNSSMTTPTKRLNAKK